MYITNATLDIKEARKITLHLTPSVKGLNLASRVGAYGESINFSLNGFTSLVKGDSMNLDLVPGKPLTTFISDRFKAIAKEQQERGSSGSAYQKRLSTIFDSFAASLNQGYALFSEVVKFEGSELGYPKKLQDQVISAGNVPMFDIHSVVVETIRDYIKNVTGNPNVIVILPNLNIYLREWIIDRMLEARTDPEKNLLTDEDQQVAEAYSTAAMADMTRARLTRDPAGKVVLNKPFAAASVASSGTNLAYGDYSEMLTVVKNILSGLGLKLVLRNEAWHWDPVYEREREITAADPDLDPPSLGATPIKSVIPNSRIFMLDPQRGKSAAETVQDFINQNQFRANLTTRSSNIIPNHEETLDSVKNAIQSKTKSSYPLEIVSFTENDKALLDYWNALKAFPTFGGVKETFRDETESRMISPVEEDREYIVWGDLGLINAYLYGQVNLEERDAKRQKYRDDMRSIQEEHTKRLQKNHPSYVGTGDSTEYTKEEKQKLNKKLKNDEFTALLKSFTVYALGPADYAILANSAYQQNLQDVLEPQKRISSWGPFKGSNIETDSFEFTTQALSEEGKDSLSKWSTTAALDKSGDSLYPVFRYNMKDSNVLDLGTNFGFNYFSVLDFGVNKQIDRLASEVVAGTLDTPYGSFAIQTMDDAVKFLSRLAGANGEPPDWAIHSLRSRLGDNLTGMWGAWSARFGTVATIDGLIEAILYKVKQNQKKPHGTTVTVPQDVESNPFSILSQVASKAYRLAVQARIKTLPFFALSTPANTMFSHCVLLAQDNPIIKQWSDKSPLNRSILNSFFSGVWRIMGFKHVISGDGDSFSEFNLVASKPSMREPVDQDFILEQEGYKF